MAGLLLTPALINQDWGNALLTAATSLAECNGINDLINDGVRLPRAQGQTSTDALVAAGLSQADATLHVSSFAEVAALWKFSTNAQTVAMTDFWFHARQQFGTNPMPK
jgi:hypothetical protein